MMQNDTDLFGKCDMEKALWQGTWNMKYESNCCCTEFCGKYSPAGWTHMMKGLENYDKRKLKEGKSRQELSLMRIMIKHLQRIEAQKIMENLLIKIWRIAPT